MRRHGVRCSETGAMVACVKEVPALRMQRSRSMPPCRDAASAGPAGHRRRRQLANIQCSRPSDGGSSVRRGSRRWLVQGAAQCMGVLERPGRRTAHCRRNLRRSTPCLQTDAFRRTWLHRHCAMMLGAATSRRVSVARPGAQDVNDSTAVPTSWEKRGDVPLFTVAGLMAAAAHPHDPAHRGTRLDLLM